MIALRVLHVEDELDIREIVAMLLDHADFNNRNCGSGEEALAIAGQWLPDIILLDVKMPGMDGLTVFSRLRQNIHTAKIPVILLTACVQRRDIAHFNSLGALSVIPKPFDPMTLASSVLGLARPTLNRMHA